ncbi:MAG: DUF58 domain-containing protein [Bacteroidales bacterium]|nr:DUF58 domain-containing protein [Bacteroidales bacterium]MCP5515582.1 DUF58 domain-containing protein [Spirochaetales bacterium]
MVSKVDASDLIRKVRKIEIKTRGLSQQVFAGEYHSAFKGRGVMFSEVREYQYGDDIRNIDWNVTARFNHPFVKVFEEERELTVLLLVDTSGSRDFGSVSQLRRNILTEISAVLSFSAIQNNDKIGLILFSDRVEKFIPPKKGRKHILYIIRELLGFEPQSPKTDLTEPLVYLTNAIKKRCTAFVLSDFISPSFDDALKIASRKHDIVALQVYDQRDKEIPDAGLMQFQDSESGKLKWVDTSLASVRQQYKENWAKRQQRLVNTFTRSGVDYTSVSTAEDYVKPLITLFKNR